MLIGIDASRALRPKRTGTERYAFEIIRHLLALPEGRAHQWRLYVADATDAAYFSMGAAGAEHAEIRLLPQVRAWTHRRLAAELASHPPDVCFVPAHVLPLRVGRVLAPSVMTIHDLGFVHFPKAHPLAQRLYLQWSTRHAARTATRLIAVSQATARDLTAYTSVRPDKVCVVYEAASALPEADRAQIAAVRARYGLARPYALYVGTIQPRKNVARLAQAYAQLCRQDDPGFDLVLAGAPGWLSTPILDEIRGLGLPDSIRLPGYLPDVDLAPLLSGAHQFCYPSLFEGFGLPILEAQSVGVPVMTATNSSLPEVAGDAALLVDPLDVDALADAMLRLSRDPALREHLIQAGYENVKRFSWEKAARETLAVLEEAARAAR